MNRLSLAAQRRLFGWCMTVVACAAGYRSPEDRYASQPKVRFRREDVIECR